MFNYVSEMYVVTEMVPDTRESFIDVQKKALDVAKNYLKLCQGVSPDETYKGVSLLFDAIDGDDYGDGSQEKIVVKWRINMVPIQEEKFIGVVNDIGTETIYNVYIKGEKRFSGQFLSVGQWLEDNEYEENELEILEEQYDIYGLIEELGGNTNENSISKTGELR